MRHRVGYNRLGRKAAHRRAMLKNMATSLLRHERIKTTTPKAKEARKLVERLITRAKVDTVHNRRIAAQTISDKEVLAKLFTEIGPRYLERPGGYTRILKIGQRRGDAAEVSIFELVGEEAKVSRKAAKKEAAQKAPEKKAEPEVEEVAVEEEATEAATDEVEETAVDVAEDTADAAEEEASAESEGDDASDEKASEEEESKVAETE